MPQTYEHIKPKFSLRCLSATCQWGDNRASKELSGKWAHVCWCELFAPSQPKSFLCLIHASCMDPYTSEAAVMASSIFPLADIYFYLRFKFPLEVQVSLWRLGFGCRATHKHSARVSTPTTGTTSLFGLICHSSYSPKDQHCWGAQYKVWRRPGARREPTGVKLGRRASALFKGISWH